MSKIACSLQILGLVKKRWTLKHSFDIGVRLLTFAYFVDSTKRFWFFLYIKKEIFLKENDEYINVKFIF